MASTFYFNGVAYSTPAVASFVNDSGFSPAVNGKGKTLIYLGDSYGGQPNVPLEFATPAEAQATLISGDLLTAVVKAFTPSAELSTPGKVLAMRVGQAINSTGNINTSGAVPVIVLASTQYGIAASKTKFQVALGSQNTTLLPKRKVTVSVGSQIVSQDNIGRTAFTVAYAGAQASATITVSASSVILSAPTGTVVSTIDLTQFRTVDDMVDQINGVAGFAATIGLNSSGAPSVGGLDYTAGAANDCKTVPFAVTATIQAIIEWLNSPACGLVVAARTGTVGGVPPAQGPTFLTCSTAPAPALTLTDWTNALNILQGVDCQVLCPLSPDTAVWAAVDAHVQFMSSLAKKERRSFVGAALGTSLATIETDALLINSDRTAIAYPGYKDFDVNGNLVTLPGYQTAALLAACFAALPPGETMTNKTVTVRGLETKLRIPTDTDILIQAGVTPLVVTAEGYKVSRAITTWTVNDNYNRVEISTGFAVDYMMQTVRDNVNPLIGHVNGPELLGRAISAAQSALDFLATPGPIGPGCLVGDADNPAWKNLTGSITGDVLILNWEGSPVIPCNFIGCIAKLNAYSGTAAAA